MSSVFLATLMLFICGCEILDPSGENPRVRSQMDSSLVATFSDGRPRIRAGVALIIQVGTIAAPAQTMNALVDQNGDITLPYLLQAPIACDGLTLDALKQKLVTAYAVYIRQPQVTVTFAPYDGRSGVSPWGIVNVQGEVANPGPVNMPSTMDLTVTKAIQLAGGLKPFADRRNIRVTRCDVDGNQKQTKVNLNEIGKEGRIDKDMVLRAGDVVWVPETWY